MNKTPRRGLVLLNPQQAAMLYIFHNAYAALLGKAAVQKEGTRGQAHVALTRVLNLSQ